MTDLQQAALDARNSAFIAASVWKHTKTDKALRQFDTALDALCEAYRALGRAEGRNNYRRACHHEWCEGNPSTADTCHWCGILAPAEPVTYGQGEGERT